MRKWLICLVVVAVAALGTVPLQAFASPSTSERVQVMQATTRAKIAAIHAELPHPTIVAMPARTVAAPLSKPAVAPSPVVAPIAAQGTSRTVSSTAYCLTGAMATGRRTYDGAVAMNGVPLYSKWQVLDGPYAGRTLTVEDRIGHGSQFDVAMPGRCAAAREYGRRRISVQQIS